MIWLLPLAALASLETLWESAAILLATMVTPLFFPAFFHDYARGLSLFETGVLVLRNFLLLAVWLSLVQKLFADGRAGLRHGRLLKEAAPGPGGPARSSPDLRPPQ
jgi:hypothetical protein